MSVMGKNEIFNKLKHLSFYVKYTTTCQNCINHHFGQIKFELNFSIVNDYQSPSNFWCFFIRDYNQTKMTHSWVGLMLFLCIYHSGFERDISVTEKMY